VLDKSILPKENNFSHHVTILFNLCERNRKKFGIIFKFNKSILK